VIDLLDVKTTRAGYVVLASSYAHRNKSKSAKIWAIIDDGEEIEAHPYYLNGRYYMHEETGLDLIEQHSTGERQ
jgi:hypothetical protein